MFKKGIHGKYTRKDNKLGLVMKTKLKPRGKIKISAAVASKLLRARRRRARWNVGVRGVGTTWGAQKKLFYGLVIRRYLSMLPASQSRRLFMMFHYLSGKKWNPRSFLASLRLLLPKQAKEKRGVSSSPRLFVISHCFRSIRRPSRLFIQRNGKYVLRRLRKKPVLGSSVSKVFIKANLKKNNKKKKRMSRKRSFLFFRRASRRFLKARKFFIYRRLLYGSSLKKKMKRDHRLVSKILKKLRSRRLLRLFKYKCKLSARRLVLLRSLKFRSKGKGGDFLVTKRFRRLKRYFLSPKLDSLYRHLVARRRRSWLKKTKFFKVRRRWGSPKINFLGRKKRFFIVKKLLRLKPKSVKGMKKRKNFANKFNHPRLRVGFRKNKKPNRFGFQSYKFKNKKFGGENSRFTPNKTNKWSNRFNFKYSKNNKGKAFVSHSKSPKQLNWLGKKKWSKKFRGFNKHHSKNKKMFVSRFVLKRPSSSLYLKLRRYFIKQLNRLHKQKSFSYKRFAVGYSLLPSINRTGVRFWKYYFYSRMLLSSWRPLNNSFFNDKLRLFRRFMLRGKLNRLGYYGKEYSIRRFTSVSLRSLFVRGLMAEGSVGLSLLPTKLLMSKCDKALLYTRTINSIFFKNKQWYKLTGEPLPYHRYEPDRSKEALSVEAPTTVVANRPLVLQEPYKVGVASIHGIRNLRDGSASIPQNVSHLSLVNYYGQRRGSFFTKSTKSGKISARSNKLLYV